MMRITFLAALLLTATSAAPTPAAGATRSYSVTSFERIRVDGGYRVTLSTGVAPFATAEGSAQALDGVSVEVQGRTLIVRSNPASWGGYPGSGRGPVEIKLGTHELAAAWVNGSGSLGIDHIKGLTFDLSVQGAGSAAVDDVAVDQLHLALAGAASAKLKGVAPRLTAIVRGTSVLDGGDLVTKDSTIGADGPSIVKLTATGTAKVDALGTATITLSGNPACTVKTAGSASVEGCR